MGLLDDDKIFAGHLDALSEMLENNEINPVIDSIWRFERVAEAQMHMHDRKNRGKYSSISLQSNHSLTGLVAPHA